ncbi:MAG: F-type H+/Na+-transporting ATPase subunit alpha, partial [Patescibacteria group bacterium]|nr:F-type H+/Na+-transporting ATPase subunit alpha [Patescibacteria group bacterium]
MKVYNTLKQGWDKPLKMEEQVAVIFAAVNGYLDKVMVDQIPAWERDYLKYMHQTERALLKTIATDQKIEEKSEKGLQEAVQAFNALHPEYMEEQKTN